MGKDSLAKCGIWHVWQCSCELPYPCYFTNTYFSYVVENGSTSFMPSQLNTVKKGSPYSIAERRVPELIPVLGSQPAGDVSHNPGGRLSLLSARPAVTRAVDPVFQRL